MKHITDTRSMIRPAQWLLRVGVITAAVLVMVSSGCSRLRLPAIDPTGSCLLSPCPTTTGLALPGSGGEGCCCLGCLSNLGTCFSCPCLSMPEPAFVEPADPPPCATPAPSTAAPGASDEPCVRSAPCNGSCLNGPRAVLLGGEIDETCGCRLPDRGKRGCILLTPQKVVAPVGGEVVLLSGICGTDGYLQMNEKLEWMLTPDSVGTFIQVGDDDPGVLGRLVGSSVRPEKKDPSYAIGITSTKRTLITRGNMDGRDDVQLEKGQTWLTISSPSEGVSRVTVLAPESECWDQRKSTATIYWVDAKWTFPAPQSVAAGTPVDLNTRVTRSEGTLPARGWKVRYEILNPELATFAGTGGSSIVEATVNDSGDATATLEPISGTSGNATIAISVIRPGGENDNLPSLTLGQGQAFVTWSSPQLTLRAGGPDVASYGERFTVYANVANPGDQPARNVRVEVPLPPGAQALATNAYGTLVENSGVYWDIDELPPQQQLDLFVDLTASSPLILNFTARAEGGLVAEATTRVDIYRPSLTMTIAPVQDRVEAGQPVTFNIDVTNTSDRPLTNARIVARGDSMMIHQSGDNAVTDQKDSVLQAGETWRKEVIFTPTSAGSRCINVEATTDGGQRATQQSCVIVINPIPETPVLSARIDGASQLTTGQTVTATTQIFNEGRGEARNVRVDMIFDPQLQPFEATEGVDNRRMGQNVLSWTVPSIRPGQSVPLAATFQAMAANPQSQVRVRAESDNGATAQAALRIAVVGAPVPPQDPVRPPSLPPATPPPEIPGGPAPLQGAPPPVTPPPAQPQRSGRLLTTLRVLDNPVRVNDPIRYSVRITNDSNVVDSRIDIQTPLPDGISVIRLVPLTNPELGSYEIKNQTVLYPEVIRLEPGESIQFEVVMRSNQAKEFEFELRVRSQNQPEGFSERITTMVVP